MLIHPNLLSAGALPERNHGGYFLEFRPVLRPVLLWARVKCVYASVRLASKPTGKLRLKYASSEFRRHLFDQRRHLFELKYLEALSFRRNLPCRTHFYGRNFQTQFTRWLRRKTHRRILPPARAEGYFRVRVTHIHIVTISVIKGY